MVATGQKELLRWRKQRRFAGLSRRWCAIALQREDLAEATMVRSMRV